MKKFTLYIILPALILFTYFSTKAFYNIQKTDISVLKKCHTTKMNKVLLCPGGAKYTRTNQISKHFMNLIVISEDAAFFSHKGFDWHEIKESFKINIKALSYLRGGSTITQQLVKNVFLSPEKSIQRKFIEAMLASKIEKEYSKNVILERYVNVIAFGKNTFGIKQAARHYFKKSPAELNVLESAFLVYLVPSPNKYSKIFYDKKLTSYSRKRIKRLIKKLLLFNKISQQDHDIAISKIDEFPWANTNLHILPTQNINSDDSGPRIEDLPDQDEEKIQEEISEEIRKELNDENTFLEDSQTDTSEDSTNADSVN